MLRLFSFINVDKIKEFIKKYIQPSLYIRGVEDFLTFWRAADVRDRGILLLVFAPMFVCLAGLAFTLVYFVLFVLPSYFFSFIGWALLTAIFGEGGNYFYNRFANKNNITTTTNNPEYIDVQYSENKNAK